MVVYCGKGQFRRYMEKFTSFKNGRLNFDLRKENGEFSKN